MFNLKYATQEEIPAEVRHLYVKVDDGYAIVEAGKMKTVEDVSRVQEGLRKEREDHAATKAELRKFGNLKADEVLSELDKIEEYKLAAEGKMDDAKIEQLVESRLRTKTAPLEREISTLKQTNSTLEASVQTHQQNEKRRTIEDHIRKAGVTAKVRETALEDALVIGMNVFDVDESGAVVTKDGVGVTPGVGADVWLTEVKSTRPHWWDESQGAGAKGGAGTSFGNNPFSADHWNMTEQAKVIQTDRSKADQMARSAGTTVGGPKPTK